MYIAPDGKAPKKFKVVAIVCAYNEEDIVASSIEHMIDQGLDVYFIDNWSTDDTFGIASKYLNKGVMAIEKFPPEGRESGGHDLLRTLYHIEELSRTIKADWFIHHDIDEYREGCWPGVRLKDAIYHVDILGYNAIDFTIVEFKMVDDNFVPGDDFVEYFKYWDWARHSGHFVQIKSWKNGKYIVDLASSAGHNATFVNRKVFPEKFLLRHYPFRSLEQCHRKLFKERRDGIEGEKSKKRGWGVQYDVFREQDDYIEDSGNLYFWDEDFYDIFHEERLYGTGILKDTK